MMGIYRFNLPPPVPDPTESFDWTDCLVVVFLFVCNDTQQMPCFVSVSIRRVCFISIQTESVRVHSKPQVQTRYSRMDGGDLRYDLAR